MRTLQVRDFFLSEQYAFSLFDMNHQMMEDVHRHEFDELVIVRYGSGFHIINDQVEFIYKGDFFLVAANDIHCYQSTNKLSVINVLLHKEREFKFIQNIDALIHPIAEPPCTMKKHRVSLTDEELNKIGSVADMINSQCDAEFDSHYFACAESGPVLRSVSITAPKSPKTAPEAPTVAVTHCLDEGSANSRTATLPPIAESRNRAV